MDPELCKSFDRDSLGSDAFGFVLRGASQVPLGIRRLALDLILLLSVHCGRLFTRAYCAIFELQFISFPACLKKPLTSKSDRVRPRLELQVKHDPGTIEYAY